MSRVSSHLQRLYPHVPVRAQNLGISIFGLFYRKDRLGGVFAKTVRGFRERDRWSPEQMDAYVGDQLRRLLKHAFLECSFYRKSWTAAGISERDFRTFTPSALPSLPIVSKKDLRDQPHAFLAKNRGGLGRTATQSTSGTTGMSLEIAYTQAAHQQFMGAREARSLGWAGTSIRRARGTIGGRMIVPRADAPPPYFRYNWAEKQVYLSAFHIRPQNANHYLDAINRYQPRLFTGYASSYHSLARMLLKQGKALNYRPDALVLSADKLTAEMKQTIGQAFRARAYEEYSSVENAVLATECEHGSLHVNVDFGILELVDEQGQPVKPGQQGRVLCTGFLNSAQPLIRYDIGDLGIWSDKACSCGRSHLPVLKEIVGRIEDALVGPDGRELVRVHNFSGIPYVIEAQIIQERIDLVRVLVIAEPGFGPAEEQVIRNRVATERLGNIEVKIERVNELESTERGKRRSVIRKVKLPV